MKKKLSPAEAFMALSDEEKERQLKEYDEPFVFEKGRPMTAAQRKLWEKAKARKPGRPRVGRGVKVISLSVEQGVLEKIDRAARMQRVSRSELLTMPWRISRNGRHKKTG
jgi:hypothetical protein